MTSLVAIVVVFLNMQLHFWFWSGLCLTIVVVVRVVHVWVHVVVNWILMDQIPIVDPLITTFVWISHGPCRVVAKTGCDFANDRHSQYHHRGYQSCCRILRKLGYSSHSHFAESWIGNPPSMTKHHHQHYHTPPTPTPTPATTPTTTTTAIYQQ